MTKEEAKKADEWKSKNGYAMDEVTSALQKAIRRGDEELAGFWAMEAVDSGYGSYLLHRLSVIACEDIGLADPMAAVLVGVVKSVIEDRMEDQRKRGRWASFPHEMIGLLILYLCRAPKSRQADDFMWLIQRRRKAGWKAEVPGYALDEHTKRGKARIKRIAAERGVAQAKVAEEIFYTEAGLLKNAVDVDGRNWTRELFKDMELPYTGYRLEE
jgi:replication-associated recombination protein RarA